MKERAREISKVSDKPCKERESTYMTDIRSEGEGAQKETERSRDRERERARIWERERERERETVCSQTFSADTDDNALLVYKVRWR